MGESKVAATSKLQEINHLVHIYFIKLHSGVLRASSERAAEAEAQNLAMPRQEDEEPQAGPEVEKNEGDDRGPRKKGKVC